MKKMISVVLMTCMLFSLFNIAFASDYETSIYKEDIEELNAIGIFNGDENGDFKPKECLTRAEFAKVICSMLNYNFDLSDIKVMGFSDLPKEHWAYGYISFVVAEGYMIGGDDKRFRPDDCIRGIEALKTLINILGYEYKASLKGGYPIGYNIVANDLSMYKGLKIDINDYILRGEIARMLNNALDVPLVINKTIGDKYEYEVNPDKTILTENLSMKRLKGKVLATDSASILNYDCTPDNSINISDVIIKLNDNSYSDYLGYNVSAIYKFDKDDKSNNEIVYIKNNKTEYLDISTEDIQGFKANNLFYEKDDEEEKISLSKTADYILNNDNIKFDKTIFDNLNEGKVTFIKSGKGSLYDVILIKDYKTVIADVKDNKNKMIIDKYSNNKIDFNNNDILYNITLNGEKSDFSAINKGDVINYAIGQRYADIKITRNIITGKIKETGSEGDITINNETYKVNNYFKANDFKLRPDMSVKCFMDAFNKVTYFESLKDESSSYAYLINIKENKHAGEPVVYGKFFNKNGEMVTYEFNNIIKINGEIVKNPDYFNIYNKIVKDGKIDGIYSLKIENNKIKEILSAKTKNEIESSGEDGLCLMYPLKTRKFLSESKTYDFEIYVNDNIPFMIIPNNPVNADEKDFKISDYHSFKEDKVHLEAYTESINDVWPSLVVVRGTSTGSFEGHDITCVVSKVAEAIDKDGSPITKFDIIKGKYNGPEEMSLYSYDDLKDDKYDIKDIKVGDILKIMFEKDGEITKFQVISKTDEEYIAPDDNSNNNKIYSRKVEDIKQGFIFLKDDKGVQQMFLLDNIKIVVIDKTREKIRVKTGNISDITENDNVIIQIISRMPQILYVFKV